MLTFNVSFIILIANNALSIYKSLAIKEHGNGGVPGGPRGLQIRSVLTTVGIGGFDSHTFPLSRSLY